LEYDLKFDIADRCHAFTRNFRLDPVFIVLAGCPKVVRMPTADTIRRCRNGLYNGLEFNRNISTSPDRE